MSEFPEQLIEPRFKPLAVRRPLARSLSTQPPGASTAPTDAAQFPPDMRLIDRVRYTIRARQYSYKTETAYVTWVLDFIRFSGRKHPADLGPDQIRRYLEHLSVERNCAASTFRQALSALLFLYTQVLAVELPWIEGLKIPKKPARQPVVLTPMEITRLFA